MPAKRRTRIEPGIYTRPDGRYEIGWRDAEGRQRWRKVDGGITAARKALRAELTKRDRGEKVAADPRLRFDAAADAWWEARAIKLRPTTQSAYRAGLIHLRRDFGRRRMTDVSPADVAAFVTRQEATLKSWTIRGQLVVLRQVFAYAIRHLGVPGSNPVDLLERVERPRTGDERPKRILNVDELERLIESVKPSHRLIFEFAAETGGRLAEVLGVCWAEVDVDAQTITFAHQLDRKGRRIPPKTKRSRRTLEITPGLASRLRAHKLASAYSADHNLVFSTARGSGHDHRNIGGRVLGRAVKLAGVEATPGLPEPTFHSLRHSHGSALIAAGWDLEEASARLGHADIGTTQRTYVHAYDAARRSDARRSRLAALYGSAMEARGSSTAQQTATAEPADLALRWETRSAAQ